MLSDSIAKLGVVSFIKFMRNMQTYSYFWHEMERFVAKKGHKNKTKTLTPSHQCHSNASTALSEMTIDSLQQLNFKFHLFLFVNSIAIFKMVTFTFSE